MVTETKERRLGEPKTEAERAETHARLYPGEPVPTQGTGQIIDHELETKINKLRTELETLRDEVYERIRGVRLSDWVLPESGALIINPERAKATPCKCFTYSGRDYCWSPGAIGMLKEEEMPLYCPTKEYEVRPGIKQRFEEFSEAAEEAHKEIEEIPKGERLVPWLEAMGKALSKRGIEV